MVLVGQSQRSTMTGETGPADTLENPLAIHQQATFPLYISKPTTLMLPSNHYKMALTEM